MQYDNNFLGFNNFIWFNGVVEDRARPTETRQSKSALCEPHTQDKAYYHGGLALVAGGLNYKCRYFRLGRTLSC